MRNGKQYLLQLDASQTIIPSDGDQATIFDWTGGNSFQVNLIVSTQADTYQAGAWSTTGIAHVGAIRDNAYNEGNLQGSKLRYRDANGNSESREIIGIKELG
jgi:hypothetical protein